MKGKFKNKLIVLLLALLSLFVFGGCTLTDGLEDVLSDRNLTAQVTYYANGGAFGNNVKEKNFYYPENAKAINISQTSITSGSIKIERAGYELVGWYFVELDGNGQPVFENEEEGVYKLEDEVNFNQLLQKGDHWIVAAKWRALVGIKVVMVCEEGATVEVGQAKDGITAGATSFTNGDEIGELSYSSKGVANLSTALPDSKLFTVKDKAFTFLSYYMDAACTVPAPNSVTRGEEDITIYAKYLTGNWNLVKEAGDLSDMFKGKAENYYLVNDIDYTGKGLIQPSKDFKGVIQGNGHTISNLKIGKTLLASDTQISMFGNIAQGAKIENITFENVTMEYTAKTELFPEIYGVFTSLAEDATIENVTIRGTLSFSGPGQSAASNMMSGYTHCLFGGYASDAVYTADGFKVRLTIDGNAVGNLS